MNLSFTRANYERALIVRHRCREAVTL